MTLKYINAMILNHSYGRHWTLGDDIGVSSDTILDAVNEKRKLDIYMRLRCQNVNGTIFTSDMHIRERKEEP